jgi:hypothetical protein
MSTGMAALTCVRAELMVAVEDVLDMQGKMTEGNDYYVRATKEIDDANDYVHKLVLLDQSSRALKQWNNLKSYKSPLVHT